jgi:hypothetical protein
VDHHHFDYIKKFHQNNTASQTSILSTLDITKLAGTEGLSHDSGDQPFFAGYI